MKYILFICISMTCIWGEEEEFVVYWKKYFSEQIPQGESMLSAMDVWRKGLAFERKCRAKGIEDSENYTESCLKKWWLEYNMDVVEPSARDAVRQYIESFAGVTDNKELKILLAAPEKSPFYPKEEGERKLFLNCIAQCNALIPKPVISLMPEAQEPDAEKLYVTIVFKKQDFLFVPERAGDHGALVLEYFDVTKKPPGWNTVMVHLGGGSGSSGSGGKGEYKVHYHDRQQALEFVLWTTQCLTEANDHTVVPFFRHSTFCLNRKAAREDILQKISRAEFPWRFPYNMRGTKSNDNCHTYLARALEALGGSFFNKKGEKIEFASYPWLYRGANDLREIIEQTDPKLQQVTLMHRPILDSYLTQKDLRVLSHPMRIYSAYGIEEERRGLVLLFLATPEAPIPLHEHREATSSAIPGKSIDSRVTAPGLLPGQSSRKGVFK